MDIEAHELKYRIIQGEFFHFFDVREPWEYDEANINAKSLPLTSIPSRIDQLLHFQNEEIIVHCKSGSRSQQAKLFLQSKGFTQVKSLIGGMEAYHALT